MRQLTPQIQSQPASSRTSRRLRASALLLLASSLVALAAPLAAQETVSLSLAGGSVVRIYSADYVLARWVRSLGERLWLEIPGYGSAELLVPGSATGAAAYYPHSVPDVRAALAAVAHPALPESLSVYCLPYPRAGLTSSSTAGRRIFLSPGILPFAPEVTHMVATHELGHVVHNCHLPDSDLAGWAAYRGLRSITDLSVYCEDAQHRNRPHEIFAEDFRFLFGGVLANYSGTIENGALPLPDAVPGLFSFLLALGQGQALAPAAGELVASNYPNPFNPQTRLTVEAARGFLGAPLSVEVFDAAGRLVRRLHAGALERTRLELQWDGCNERGVALPTGVYFARVRLGAQQLSHKMLLIG